MNIAEASQTAQKTHEALSNHWKNLKPKTRTLINSRLIGMEKSFLHDEGMPFGKWYQSVFGAPDPFSGYASWMLPALKYYEDAQDSDNLRKWDGIYSRKLQDLTTRLTTINETIRVETEKK